MKFNNKLFSGFPINRQLKQEIDDIMKRVWRNTRHLFLFYFCCCVGVIANYFFTAFFVNLYHQLRQTPDYEYFLRKYCRRKQNIINLQLNSIPLIVKLN